MLSEVRGDRKIKKKKKKWKQIGRKGVNRNL